MSIGDDWMYRENAEREQLAPKPLRHELVQEISALKAALLASQESAKRLAEALEMAMPTLKTCDPPEVSFDGDLAFWLERKEHAIRDGEAALERHYCPTAYRDSGRGAGEGGNP